MRTVLILVSAVLLAGCLNTDPTRWEGGRYDGRRAAVYDCKELVDAKTARAAAFGGAIAPLIALVTASSDFNECMAAKGFVGVTP